MLRSLFDDPDPTERKLYCQYWQNKLASNDEIDFPDSLLDEIVDITDKFSFAFLKEGLYVHLPASCLISFLTYISSVSALVTLAGYDDPKKKPSFGEEIKTQITALRKQLSDDTPSSDVYGDTSDNFPGAWTGSASRTPVLNNELPRVDVRRFEENTERIWVAGSVDPMHGRIQRSPLMPGEMPAPAGVEDGMTRDGRDMRSRALQATALGRSFLF